MSIVVHAKTFQLPTPGLHEGGLVGVEDLGTHDYGNGARPMLRLTFVINERDERGQALEVSTLATPSLHPKSKLFSFASVLLGGPVPAELSMDDLIGLPCQLVISHRQDKQGRTWPSVDQLLPAPAPAGTFTAAAAFRGEMAARRFPQAAGQTFVLPNTQ